MKRLVRGLGRVLLLVLLGAGAAAAYLQFAFPRGGPAPALKLESTPARLARGEYLARSVCACLDCHSQRDWTRFSAPVIPGTDGLGGEKFPLPFGDLYAPNLTPEHLGKWTDGEIYRAITRGVSRDGSPLFPLMPYPRYGQMDSEDIYSIIVYLRTLPPRPDNVPRSALRFPMSWIVRTMPQAENPHALPPPEDEVARGKYVLNAASCAECHTPQLRGKPLPGMELAGGFEFPLPGGQVVRSANLTPDPATGLGNWSRERFIDRFRLHQSPILKSGQQNTIMPWSNYAGMTERDLGALYAYLRTVPAVPNAVKQNAGVAPQRPERSAP